MLNPNQEPELQEIYNAVNERTKRIIKLEDQTKELLEYYSCYDTMQQDLKQLTVEIIALKNRVADIEKHINQLSLYAELRPKIYL